MITYYLELKKNTLHMHSIHVKGCPNMTSIDKELLLGDFTAVNAAYNYARWHFPEWDIHICSCCQAMDERVKKAG